MGFSTVLLAVFLGTQLPDQPSLVTEYQSLVNCLQLALARVNTNNNSNWHLLNASDVLGALPRPLHLQTHLTSTITWGRDTAFLRIADYPVHFTG